MPHVFLYVEIVHRGSETKNTRKCEKNISEIIKLRNTISTINFFADEEDLCIAEIRNKGEVTDCRASNQISQQSMDNRWCFSLSHTG